MFSTFRAEQPVQRIGASQFAQTRIKLQGRLAPLADLVVSQILKTVRTAFVIVFVAALLGCIVCYSLGYRSGIKQSRLEEDQRGLVVLTLTGYKEAEATNWPKVKSLLATELFGFTRDYERRFGTPTGTGDFVPRFHEAKGMADRIEKEMVPLSAFGVPLGSNGTGKTGN